jgi:hypothetical protein
VFPAYTLAPEAQYPTQQEQCYAAVKWVREHGHSKELDEEKFAIVSDSAGGMRTVFPFIFQQKFRLTSRRSTFRRNDYSMLYALS